MANTVAPFSSLRRPQASFLLSASPPVIKEFAKIASNIIVNGGNMGKGYTNAATKLQVTVEAVEQAVLMLCDIFTRVARLNLSAQATLSLLEDVGFMESPRETLSEYLLQIIGDIREVIANSSLSVPVYRKLEWRLDVQVASRSLRNQATPSFLLNLSTSCNNGTPTNNDTSTAETKSLHLEADYATLKAACAELEQAVAASSSMHSRRIIRHFR